MSVSAFAVNVQFSGFGISSALPAPNTVDIAQREFAHDICTLQYWGGNAEADALASGQPVMVQWGTPPSMRIFYGYVSHPTRNSNALSSAMTPVDRNSTTVTCVGASWYMKQPGNQNFSGYTADQIVQVIGGMFGLAVDATPHPTVWPSLQMAGKSYWAFCCKLAHMIGYTFYCNGIQLEFNPRTTDPNNLGALAAVYDYKVNPMAMPIFTPTLGAASPFGGQLMNRQLAGVNARTGQVVFSETSGSPSRTNMGTTMETPPFNCVEHFSVRSQEEASTKTQGAGLLNQLYLTATASAGGNPYVAQGSLIYVQNANGAQNGLWYTTEAQHCMTKQNYQMNLSLGRDSRGPTSSISVQTVLPNSPQAILVNNRWVAL